MFACVLPQFAEARVLDSAMVCSESGLRKHSPRQDNGTACNVSFVCCIAWHSIRHVSSKRDFPCGGQLLAHELKFACRLIPFAHVQSFMNKTLHGEPCPLYEGLLPQGDLGDYTVIVWLNDLPVSYTKEQLKEGDAFRESQFAWLASVIQSHAVLDVACTLQSLLQSA